MESTAQIESPPVLAEYHESAGVGGRLVVDVALGTSPLQPWLARAARGQQRQASNSGGTSPGGQHQRQRLAGSKPASPNANSGPRATRTSLLHLPPIPCAVTSSVLRTPYIFASFPSSHRHRVFLLLLLHRCSVSSLGARVSFSRPWCEAAHSINFFPALAPDFSLSSKRQRPQSATEP